MALTVRLKQVGKKNRKQWQIVVADKRTARNSRLIDELGSYDSLVNPPQVKVNMERYTKWIEKGAVPSKTVEDLVKKEKK
ncbi:MAG: 30S ribosomal protein S16 [Candidatus Omnitrophica bacterium]|nr:30S ribosomal protein S16 [Candidatus Omnitrophota bacterium]